MSAELTAYVAPTGEYVRGVQFVEPPAERLPSILDAMKANIAAIPDGKKGVAVLLVNEQGANAAIVTRTKWDIDVHFWVAKEWKGSFNYGVMAVKEF